MSYSIPSRFQLNRSVRASHKNNNTLVNQNSSLVAYGRRKSKRDNQLHLKNQRLFLTPTLSNNSNVIICSSSSSEQETTPVLRRPELRTSSDSNNSTSNSAENVQQKQVDLGANSTTTDKRSITVEEQREIAKELVTYFKEQSMRQSTTAERLLGWTATNEITNGRWVMFGLLVGLLTEYATGVNFVDQIRITISNLGIADVYE